MAEKTSWTGAALTETDINTYLRHTGSAFATWTPAVTQSGAVTVTVNRGTYWRAGRLIVAHCFVTATGTGTASNAVVVTLPVATNGSYQTRAVLGSGHLYDTSAATNYIHAPIWISTTTVQLLGTSGALGAAGFTAALAVGDEISFTVQYEAAS